MQNGLAAIVILDFSPRLENRCKLFPVYTLFRASILDFKPKLGNRCKLFPVYALQRASILDFRPRLGNRCSAIAATVRNGPPAACRGAQAGTGCHEGGIILSKKAAGVAPAPAAITNCVRFKFSSSQSRTVPPAVVVVATKNGPPAAWSWGAGGDRTPRRRHNPK